jgi:hypothetical protein
VAVSPTITKPQLPRPVAVVKGSTWTDIWNGIATLSKQNQNLVQYLQTYLTHVYNWLVPPKVDVSVVVPPYTINATDSFIAATGGQINLPQSSGSGRVITIKNIDPASAGVLITPDGTDMIDGGTTYLLGPEFEVVSLVDGQVGQWWIL